MRITRFGTFTMPEGDGSDKHNVAGLSALTEVYGGGYDQLGGVFVPRPKQVQRGFTLYATETQTIEQQLDALMQQASKGRRVLRAETRDGDTLLTWAKVVAVDTPRNVGTAGHQPVNVTFEIAHPYWYSADDAPYLLDDGHVLDDGWTLDAGNNSSTTVSGASTNWTITYTGNVPTRYGVLAIAPGAGEDITNITVTNTTTNEILTYVGTVDAGETLTLDMLTETALLDGTNVYANLSRPSNQLAWLSLTPGSNAITITCASVTGTVDVQWYWMRAYLR